MLLKYSVGIDMSMKSFACSILTIDSDQNIKVIGSRKFANALNGFKNFYEWSVKKHKEVNVPIVYCVEATGVYHENLSFFLHDKNCSLSIILANTSNKYLASLGLKSKTDPIDAKGLAQMGAERKLTLWNPPAKFYSDLRSLTRHHQSLTEDKTAVSNKLHAINHSAKRSKFVINQFEKQIKYFDKNLKLTSQKITQAIDSRSEVRSKVDRICTIHGVGEHTVAIIIAETFGFELFESAKQLISYCGYDVVENQSGKTTGKTRISKKGCSRIRRAMHFPAFNAMRPDQPIFYNLYHRTFERHYIKMKSYVAVQKKLLTTIYAMWKNDTEFDPQYHIKMINTTLKKVVPIKSELHQIQL